METLPVHPTILYSQSMNHLGLVSAMFDRLEIANVIDRNIPDTNRIVSVGKLVKAMVLNGLGFVSQPLYLCPNFFKDKPVSQLLGENIEATHLNDDALGDALDAIASHDPTCIYSLIGAQAARSLGLDSSSAHLDGTSFHADGRYDKEEKEGVIQITKGYSRDHRPDLNQVILNMMVSNQSGIPLLMASASGNSDDKSTFKSIIKGHIENFNREFKSNVFVADSALYTAETIQLFKGDNVFITRVPEVSKESKQAIQNAISKPHHQIDSNYSYIETPSEYGSVEQRWIIIKSEHAQQRAKKSAIKKFQRITDAEAKLLQQASNQTFACQGDAKTHLENMQKKLKLGTITDVDIVSVLSYSKKGRPKKTDKPDIIEYKIQGNISFCIDAYDLEVSKNSHFILATNELDKNKMPPERILKEYKGQGAVERGFKFMKNPEFFTSSLNLKKPERIMALMMVMTICLLVYAALEREIRLCLKSCQKTVTNQVNKQTDNPTARWVFHIFSGIHVIIFSTGFRQIMNLNEQHKIILSVLGEDFEKYYRGS